MTNILLFLPCLQYFPARHNVEQIAGITSPRVRAINTLFMSPLIKNYYNNNINFDICNHPEGEYIKK
jgi:hypothetical protein